MCVCACACEDGHPRGWHAGIRKCRAGRQLRQAGSGCWSGGRRRGVEDNETENLEQPVFTFSSCSTRGPSTLQFTLHDRNRGSCAESFEIQRVALIKIIDLYYYYNYYYYLFFSCRKLCLCQSCIRWWSLRCFFHPAVCLAGFCFFFWFFFRSQLGPDSTHTHTHTHHLTTPFPPGPVICMWPSCVCVCVCVDQSGALCQSNSSPFVAASQLYPGACDDFMEKKKKKKATSCHR